MSKPDIVNISAYRIGKFRRGWDEMIEKIEKGAVGFTCLLSYPDFVAVFKKHEDGRISVTAGDGIADWRPRSV